MPKLNAVQFQLTDAQIRDLGFMFKKMWNSDDLGTVKGIHGFVAALDALGIPWRLVTGKTDIDFIAVEIAGKTFKL